MHITQRQHEIIVGTLLGDGCLERIGRFIRLKIGHGISQKQYFWWKYYALRSLTSKTSKPRMIRQFHRVTKKYYESLHFATKSIPELEKYWVQFYSDGKKIINSDMQELTPLSTAVWYMDDGYKRNDCNAFRLSTDAFSVNNQKRLQHLLTKNFGVASTLHKKGFYWNIYIPNKQSQRFLEVIKPYIHKSLKYKIALAP
ncbi:MAG: hypothetical protein HYS44_03025 [Candidatus Niyogibacteria bacterium]|nr:hypothetical protein [Candidatus Niyogibacteria bacterium]